MIRRTGVRAHDFGKGDIDTIAKALNEYGFDTTQLALKKALENVDSINDALIPENAAYIKKSLQDRGADISVLGCYLNYGQNDDLARQSNLDIYLKHLDLCADFGARMVGTETGSLNNDYSEHKDNHGEYAYKIFLSSVEKMTERAERTNVITAVEAVQKHIIHTAERMKRLTSDISSKNLAVIFDPVNIITAQNYKEQEYIIKEFFDLLGDKILAVHLKDFEIENGEVIVKPFGEGMLNRKLIISIILESNNEIDLLLENIKPEKMNKSSEVIRNLID